MAARYLAFDLGAESGRAVLGTLHGKHLELEEVHRFPNGMLNILGHLHWNIYRLYEEILRSIRICCNQHGPQLNGLGIDTWGVDFALIGPQNTLLGLPYAYRDKRTEGMMERVFHRIPAREIYQLTGIQFLPFNTIFQLFAMVQEKSPVLQIAQHLLFIPSLLNYLLTGEITAELTFATTSQLFNPVKQEWARDIFERLDLPLEIMPEVMEPGQVIGPLLPNLAEELQIGDTVPVIATASHDTASAVAAVPVEPSTMREGTWAYISSGTWSLMGIEIPQPIITEESFAMNFTNEGGVEGTFRFLRNIMGLWLVQECRRIWAEEGHPFEYSQLTDMAAQARPFAAFLYPDDPSFLRPANMPQAIRHFCRRTGQRPPEDRAQLIRVILEGLAFRYREVLEMLQHLCGKSIQVLHVVGGGSRNSLLCQFTANVCGLPVVAGPAEATAIGNLMVQAMAGGEVASLEDARCIIRQSFELQVYEPKETDRWEEAYEHYRTIARSN